MKWIPIVAMLFLISIDGFTQEIVSPHFFISDYTGDNILNDRDSIIIQLKGIYADIEKEEWDLSDIDLFVNDISLSEITPVRFARNVTFKQDGKEMTTDRDLLAFVLDGELLSAEKLNALRGIEQKSKVFISLKLPNDAAYNQVVEVNELHSSKKLMYWAVGTSLVIAVLLVYFAVGQETLRDKSTANNPPYSFSRSQIWWWSLITMTSIAYIWISTGTFVINSTTWILLGICSATLAVGTTIDKNDIDKGVVRHQNGSGENWFNDILQDDTGQISIHRLQSLLFNLGFGVFYLIQVYGCLELPSFDQNALILLGLSNGAYTYVKSTEN